MIQPGPRLQRPIYKPKYSRAPGTPPEFHSVRAGGNQPYIRSSYPSWSIALVLIASLISLLASCTPATCTKSKNHIRARASERQMRGSVYAVICLSARSRWGYRSNDEKEKILPYRVLLFLIFPRPPPCTSSSRYNPMTCLASSLSKSSSTVSSTRYNRSNLEINVGGRSVSRLMGNPG